MKRVFILLILCISSINSNVFSQGFKAMGIVGMNASQLDGDNLYGFNKLGLSVGGRLSYTSLSIYDLSIEMLYSQRGSSTKIFNADESEKISLNYFEFPVIFSLRDWLIESDNYYKVRAETGLSYGYLFGIKAPGFNELNFRKHDVSWIVGAGLNFTKSIGISVRYSTSLYNLYKDPAAAKSNLLGYFLTLRSEFSF
ncbi:MAG: PorT family protein [Saprospiraceae bacterium]|nr:PorT family protein [Saprospiraceae bacterium]